MTREQIAYDIATQIVSELAPEDMQDFAAIAEFQQSAPYPTGQGASGLSLNLGVAGSALIVLVLPVVSDCIKDLVKRLGQEVVDATVLRVHRALAGAPDSSLHLGKQRIAELRRDIETKALELGLAPEAAVEFGTIIEGRLS